MRTFIKGTGAVSEGRRALSRATGIRMIRRTNSRYAPRAGDVLINWGQSSESYGYIPTWINHPYAVRVATNKMACFDTWKLQGIPTVDYTTCRSQAARWRAQQGSIMHRALNSGSQGRGITIVGLEDELPVGGFYCRLFGDFSNREYRVHVMDGQVIDITQKRQRRRSNGYEGPTDRTIRSSCNGWVFARSEVECPGVLNEAAIGAVASIGLDFGAVDGAVSATGAACIYEVNTAPGLEGTTLGAYAESLGQCIRARCNVRASQGEQQ